MRSTRKKISYLLIESRRRALLEITEFNSTLNEVVKTNSHNYIDGENVKLHLARKYCKMYHKFA